MPEPTELRGDEAELYERLAVRLRRAVAARVRAPAQTVEDACPHAWLQLLRCQPERTERILAWLCLVACREAWRLTGAPLPVDGAPPTDAAVIARARNSLAQEQSRCKHPRAPLLIVGASAWAGVLRALAITRREQPTGFDTAVGTAIAVVSELVPKHAAEPKFAAADRRHTESARAPDPATKASRCLRPRWRHRWWCRPPSR